MAIMLDLTPFEGDLFLDRPLDKIENIQNRALEKTARLHDERPVYPKNPYWASLPLNVQGVEKEEYTPSGWIKKETAYNPFLMYLSLFDPNVLREVAEHEGIHAGTPGKMLLSHLYYDSRDGRIKFGYIEPDSVPSYKYPVGKAIEEGGVKVISEKIGGVEQTSYPVTSKMVEEIDRKLTEMDNNYSLVYIQKLASIAEKKLIQTNYSKFHSNPADLKMSEVPNELMEVLYILNRPQIIGTIRKFASKIDLSYIV